MMYLCELCFDALTTHVTAAWDGLETAVCDACLAPPVGHAAWRDVVAVPCRLGEIPRPACVGALGLALHEMSACEQWQQAMLNCAALYVYQQQGYPSAFA